jgi:hypothetical protein
MDRSIPLVIALDALEWFMTGGRVIVPLPNTTRSDLFSALVVPRWFFDARC